jgi:hypothetical protein
MRWYLTQNSRGSGIAMYVSIMYVMVTYMAMSLRPEVHTCEGFVSRLTESDLLT